MRTHRSISKHWKKVVLCPRSRQETTTQWGKQQGLLQTSWILWVWIVVASKCNSKRSLMSLKRGLTEILRNLSWIKTSRSSNQHWQPKLWLAYRDCTKKTRRYLIKSGTTVSTMIQRISTSTRIVFLWAVMSLAAHYTTIGRRNRNWAQSPIWWPPLRRWVL